MHKNKACLGLKTSTTPLYPTRRISSVQRNWSDHRTCCNSRTTTCSLHLCSFSLRAYRPQKATEKMGRVGKEIAGQVLSFIGLVGVSVTCGVPMWRVTSFIGANIVTGQIIWDGLWMNCVMQSTGQMQCKLNESVMSLTRDLQAARALVIISLVVGLVGFLVSFIGARCTSCLKSETSMANVVIISGCLILLAAVLDLIPVCWSAAFTIMDFQNPLTVTTQRREIGASIYIGWASAAFLLIGGIILTTSCPPRNNVYGYPGYPQPQPVYPYAAPTSYRPVYTPVSQPYSGSYVPNKPYRAPTAYSGVQ